MNKLPLIIGGDGIADSLEHSAKDGSYGIIYLSSTYRVSTGILYIQMPLSINIHKSTNEFQLPI